MLSIKAAVAAGALAASTAGGAYAAGVVNKNGHEVNAHAAHGQSVAAAARARLASALDGRGGGGQDAGQPLHRAPAQLLPIRVQCRTGGAHPSTYAVRR